MALLRFIVIGFLFSKVNVHFVTIKLIQFFATLLNRYTISFSNVLVYRKLQRDFLETCLHSDKPITWFETIMIEYS